MALHPCLWYQSNCPIWAISWYYYLLYLSPSLWLKPVIIIVQILMHLYAIYASSNAHFTRIRFYIVWASVLTTSWPSITSIFKLRYPQSLYYLFFKKSYLIIVSTDEIAFSFLSKVKLIVFTTSLTHGTISTPQMVNLIIVPTLDKKILLAILVDTAYSILVPL